MVRTAAAALFVALMEKGRAASRRIFDQISGACVLEFLHTLLKDLGELCCVGNEEVNADIRLGTIDVTEPNIITENTAVVESMRNGMPPRMQFQPLAIIPAASDILARAAKVVMELINR